LPLTAFVAFVLVFAASISWHKSLPAWHYHHRFHCSQCFWVPCIQKRCVFIFSLFCK